MAAILDQNSAMMPDPDAVRSFCADLAREGQIHLVSIAPDGGFIGGRDFVADIESATQWAIEQNIDRKGVYWTVNAVRSGVNKKTKKQDVVAARYAHVDIDPAYDGTDFDRADVLAQLQKLSLNPSFVINSGNGLQAFWRLDEPCENWETIERSNDAIRDIFGGGDSCHDISRVMRLPGTVNWPNKKKMQSGRVPVISTVQVPDDGVCYKPEEIVSAFPKVEKQDSPKLPRPKVDALQNEAFDETPDTLNVSDRLRSLIIGPMPEKYESRSDWGNAVAWAMAADGYSDAAIAGILGNPANGCAGHYVDQPDTTRAVKRSIQSARAAFPSPQIAPACIASEPESSAIATEPTWRRDLGDGLLSEYIDIVCDTAYRQQPLLALASAIAAFGTLAGKRYETWTRARTNFYILMMAGSGSGKDHPLKAAGQYLKDAGCSQHLAGSAASGASLESSLALDERDGLMLCIEDEMQNLIKGAVDQTSPPHIKEILSMMTKLFSASRSTYLGREYANPKIRPRTEIIEPNYSIIGACPSSDLFNGGIRSDHFSNGALPRFLIFDAGPNLPAPQFEREELLFTPRLIEGAKALRKGANLAGCFTVSACADAKRLYREKALQTDEKSANTDSEAKRAIIHRIDEHAVKIALVRTVTNCPSKPFMTLHDLEWGYTVAELATTSLLDLFENQVSDSMFESNAKRTLEIIKEGGREGIAGNMLTRRMKFAGERRRREDLIEYLEESELIETFNDPQPGKRGRVAKIHRAIY